MRKTSNDEIATNIKKAWEGSRMLNGREMSFAPAGWLTGRVLILAQKGESSKVETSEQRRPFPVSAQPSMLDWISFSAHLCFWPLTQSSIWLYEPKQCNPFRQTAIGKVSDVDSSSLTHSWVLSVSDLDWLGSRRLDSGLKGFLHPRYWVFLLTLPVLLSSAARPPEWSGSKAPPKDDSRGSNG